MNYFTKSCLIAAAAFVAVAGSASAQSLTAEIPFAFSAGDARMTQGTYRVFAGYSGANLMVRLDNQEDGSSRALLLAHSEDPSKKLVAAGVPALVFECVDTRCVLTKVWPSVRGSALALRTPRLKSGETAELKIVNVNAIRAE